MAAPSSLLLTQERHLLMDGYIKSIQNVNEDLKTSYTDDLRNIIAKFSDGGIIFEVTITDQMEYDDNPMILNQSVLKLVDSETGSAKTGIYIYHNPCT